MTFTHIIASLEARHGGPSRSVRALASAQSQLGHHVELVTTGSQRNDEASGNLTVRTVRRGWLRALCIAPGMTKELQSSETSLIHAHGLWLRPLHYARVAAETKHVPLIISPRGMMSGWAWRHHRWRKTIGGHLVHPRAFEAAHGFHATSNEEAEDIRGLGFSQPISVAPNGVEVPAETELIAAREHWNVACPETLTRRCALFYSRFHAKKRVLELIDLWLDHAPSDWLLLLVGIPEQYSVEELREYVYRCGGSDRIEVFDGADRPAPYAVASLCLLPSHSENFGLVVAEALAAGVPALVTDSTPWKSLHTHGAGWCVPWEDFAEALRAALGEGTEALKARGVHARAWAGREFAWEKSAQTLATFYTELLAGRAGA